MPRNWGGDLPTPDIDGFETAIRSWLNTVQSSATDLDTEVEDARAGEPDLSTRINAVAATVGSLWSAIANSSRTTATTFTVANTDATELLVADTPIRVTKADTSFQYGYVTGSVFGGVDTVVTVDFSIDVTATAFSNSNIISEQVPRGAGVQGGISDTNGNEMLDFNATGSAVNHFAFTNAATGTSPLLQAAGDDTNIDLRLFGKGSGVVRIGATGSYFNASGNLVTTQLSSINTSTNETVIRSGASNVNWSRWYQDVNERMRFGVEQGSTILAAGSANGDTVLTTVGSQNMVLGTNSTAVVTVNASGQVGIGVTPTEKVHIYHSGTHKMLMHGLDADSTLTYEMQSNSRTAFSVATYLAGGDGNSFGSIIRSRGYLQFHTGTSGSFSEAMRIDSSGKVGIGVTPSVQFHVEINDDTNQPIADFRNSAGSGSDRDAFVRFRISSDHYSVGHHAATNEFRIANTTNLDTNYSLRINSSAQVGIGTVTTISKFLVVGDGTGSFSSSENGIGINVDGSAALTIRNSTNSVEARLVCDSTSLDLGTLTTHSINFRANDSVVGSINSSGEWAVNSSTPVSGVLLRMGDGSGDKKIRMDAGSASGNQIQFYNNGSETCFINSNTTNYFTIFDGATKMLDIRGSDGHVGINTDAGSVLGLGQCLTIKSTQTATASLKLAGIEIQGNKSGETNVDCAHFEGFNTTTRLGNMVIGQGSSSNESYIRFEQRIGGSFAESFRIGEGGKLSTNGETAPDCSKGGLTLVVAGSAEIPLTYKNTSAAHGITSLGETDTLLQFRSSPGGGQYQSWFRSFGTGTGGHLHQAYCVTNVTDNDGGCFVFLAGKKSGTSATTFASSDTIMAITNNGSGAVAIKGNGDIYTETDQTSGLAGTFDEYDDFHLSSIAKMAAGGRLNYEQVSESNRQMLRDLKIMDGTFINHTNMHRLHLGRSDQMWNMMRHAFAFVGEKLGVEISEDLLKSFAKNYEPQLLGA